MIFPRLPSSSVGGSSRCACPYPAVAMARMPTIRAGGARDLSQPGQGQNQLSDQLIFSLQLLVEAVHFEFLKRTDNEATFRWPATVGAKLGGISELKTTI